jgi:arginine/lysine/ornithine decarboxylase
MNSSFADPKRTTLRQARAPVYESLLAYQQQHITPLHTPGHKGILAPGGLEAFLTPLGLACDLPSMEETDNWFHPQSCIAEAQCLAADLYGAADTFYLSNGSTIGVQAMILAAVGPGEKILLSRNFHQSTFSALVLSGAVPVYLPSKWFRATGPLPPTLDEIQRCLQEHPDTRALFLVHPSYYGIGRALDDLAAFCQQQHITLLVDEAHGAHLHLLPAGYLSSALDCGADVVVQSVHKTLCSLVGTAQMHRSHHSIVSRQRLQWALNLLQSTSANYLLLASLDLTRRWAWLSGRDAFDRVVSSCRELRSRLAAIAGIRPLDPACFAELAGCSYDPTRLVVDVSGLGLSASQLEDHLQERFHIGIEFCDNSNVVCVLGPADSPETYLRLERAFLELAKASPGKMADESRQAFTPPPVVLIPRKAAFCTNIRVPLCSAIGRVCGEVINIYPPGIPLICTGELFTADIVAACEAFLAQGACVFATDVSLATVLVLDKTETGLLL